MKTYWSIPGPTEIDGAPCIAFHKYDGSNLRFEWSKKQGWCGFGTRNRVLSVDDPLWASAFRLFLDLLAEGCERVFRDNATYRRIERATVYCECFGPSTFAGWHDWDEPKELVIFDVSIYKRGFVLPEDFVAHFGHLSVAEVVYRGVFDQTFVDNVRAGKIVQGEGVVAKGVKVGKRKHTQHDLWMSKVKTQAWLDELKRRAEQSDQFRKTLAENLAEQKQP